MGRLEGKVVLITGGGSGMGRLASVLFAREGAKVIIAEIAEGPGRETEAEIRGAGGAALFVRTDVA
ncbi:MAG: short-chain dehydrogenase/reductase SDR, partial [Armatimonadetes bacterium CSP1-3]